MPKKPTVAALAVLASLALVACGDPPAKDVPAKGNAATPEQALQEIDVVRKDLARVTNAVQTGNRKQANEILSDTYVGHFEKVEPPLDKIDHELNEELEEGLREKLR